MNRKNKTRKVKAVKKAKKVTTKKFDETAFYQRYPHVVAGSVKQVNPGEKVDGFKAIHGRVCLIMCQDCGKTRMINVQDAFQVHYCLEHQAKRAREKIAAKRKAKK